MKAAIIATMILLLPAALFAGPTMGIYFTYNAGQMHYGPMTNEMFTAYVYAQGTACYLNAAEFEVCYPPGILEIGWEVPPGSLTLGDSPDTGISITYWPPMDGWNPGYNLLCTLKLFAATGCLGVDGTLLDAPIKIVMHHDTGLIQGSCWPENYLFEYTGLTSIICPCQYGVKETNWGAIKSLF
jgi:hypothetical protein